MSDWAIMPARIVAVVGSKAIFEIKISSKAATIRKALGKYQCGVERKAHRKGGSHDREVVSLHLGFHLNLEGAFGYGKHELDPKSADICIGRNTGCPFRFVVGAPGSDGAAK